jgi:16S rRNA (cytidine1402-2'-O)-methyltransferase
LHSEGDGAQSGTLYVVATPIGNLRDITVRALDVLRNVDMIAAEDTRQTHKLLSHHGIAARMIALHAHNERRAAEQIATLLASGKSVALVTDAGTPGLSDPGARAVACVRERGLRVVPVPGPSALTAALSVSALASPRFLFAGFLPARPAERLAALEALAATSDPIVLFEAPHRVVQSVQDMARILGGKRRVVIARELTKIFEEIQDCSLDSAASWLVEKPERSRGEFVLVIGPAASREAGHVDAWERVLRILLAQLPLSQAVTLAAKITGGTRKPLYERALALKGADDGAKRQKRRRDARTVRKSG